MSLHNNKQKFEDKVISDLLKYVKHFLENVESANENNNLINNIRSAFVKLLLFGGFKISDIKLMTSLSTGILPDIISVDFYGIDVSSIPNWIVYILQKALLEVDVEIRMSLDDKTSNSTFLFTFISHKGIIIIPQITLSVIHVTDEIQKMCNSVVSYSVFYKKIIYPYDEKKSTSKFFHLANLTLFIPSNTGLRGQIHLLLPYAEVLRILNFSTHGEVSGSIFPYFNCYQNGEMNLHLISLINEIKCNSSTICDSKEGINGQCSKYIEQKLIPIPTVLVDIINSYISPCVNCGEPNSPSEFCSNLVLKIDSKIICFNCILATLRQIILKKKNRLADTFNVGELSKLCNR